jgi:hypothetical protein
MSAVKRIVSNLKKPHDPPRRAALMRDLWEAVLYEVKEIRQGDMDDAFSRMANLNMTLKPMYGVLMWRILWEIFRGFDKTSKCDSGAAEQITPLASGRADAS